MLEQVVYRGVHDFGERERIDAHGQDAGRQQAEHQQLAAADVLQFRDMRVADASARLSFKQARMAVTTAWGTLARLVSVVGHGTASRLLLTAQEVTAMEARVLRLVDHVTERDGECLALALAWASDVEQAAPSAVAAMKSLLRDARGASYERLRPIEREAFVSLCGEPKSQARMEHMLMKNAPLRN